MPTVFRVGPCRFFFFSSSVTGFEPPHANVEAADGYAKLSLRPVAFAEVHRFNAKQMREVRRMVQDHVIELWNDHFGRQE